MEAIALVPTIETLLAQGCKEKKKKALDIIIKNVGMIGFLLSDVLKYIDPSDNPEEKELFHLIRSMVCFYTQKYEECVEHAILSKQEWFKASEDHCASLGLYFQESRNRIIRSYIERQEAHSTDIEEFMQVLLSSEKNGSNSFSVLGLHINTKNISAIEEFVKRNTHILYNDEELQFLLEEVKIKRIYLDIFYIFEEFWRADMNERYSLLFYKVLLDSYLYEKNEKSLKELINYLAENKLEIALYIAFILHDRSPVISQIIAEDMKHPSVFSLLSGKFQSSIYQKFLSEKNQVSFSLLSELSKSQSSKLSMNHMSLSFCNGIMNSKTANDTYLRKNLEWMRQAKNWSKFVVASSFGMIHTDSEDPFEILRHYLPMAPVRESEKDDPESGGALFALGLICLNSPSTADSFLSTFFDAELESRRGHILYGTCLGLGLTRLGTGDEESISRFKDVLYADTVTISEAAAYAIGLVNAGRFNHSLVKELLTYAKDTEHEKISRSIGVSVALQMIETAETSESQELTQVLDEMLQDSNSVLRYTGALSLGAAYVATGDLSVVGKLLSIISTDASEDVKKVAIFSIGLVLTTKTETCKNANFNKDSILFKILEPLAQSHSAYVRSGVALAMGMFMAGSGCKEALEVIEVLMYDSTSYVRQHASIGAGMILMQVNANDDPLYKRIVVHMHSMTKRKSEPGAARFGALLGRSLLDACGKNGIVSIFGMSGDLSHKSICGAILFSQYWYWYPLVPFITLCMRPTLLLAVDTDLKLDPNFFVEVEGPEKEHLATTVVITDNKKHGKRFKILPIEEEEKKHESEEKPQTNDNAVEEKSHIVRNFERFTPGQHRKSCFAGLPSVIFLSKNAHKEAPLSHAEEIEKTAKIE